MSGIAASLALLAQAAAPASTAAEAPAKPLTLQERFNAASEAIGKGDCTSALSQFEALAADKRIKSGSLPAATIALRRGICEYRVGHPDLAEPLILEGLPLVAKSGPGMVDDHAEALVVLGDVAMRRWDFLAAADQYRRSVALLQGKDRIKGLVRTAQALLQEDPPAALAASEEALRIIEADKTLWGDLRASVMNVHGRALLNAGQPKEAYAELKKALEYSGGLTFKTKLYEVPLRGDLAIAAVLAGDKEAAHKYLAYTGMGRTEKSPFAVATNMAPPACSPDTGLKPDDSGIVEFTIGENGAVTYAQTIYTASGPKVAKALAQAVARWIWTPESLAPIPTFYKVNVRVELRCSRGDGQGIGVLTPLRERFAKWAGPRLGLADISFETRSDISAALATKAEEAAARDDRALQAAALLIRSYNAGNLRDRLASLDQAFAVSAGTPPEVRNLVRVEKANADMLKALPSDLYPGGAHSKRMLDLAREKELADDPLATATLAAETMRYVKPAEAVALAATVAADTRLPDTNPLHQLALLKLADAAIQSGKPAEARAYFARTGLDEEQCALIGAAPDLAKTGVNASTFPNTALSYGFEGWVKLEFDINANGTTAQARPVIAFPPYVFSDAAQGMAKGIRYKASYRPGGGTACSARSEMVRFALPH